MRGFAEAYLDGPSEAVAAQPIQPARDGFPLPPGNLCPNCRSLACYWGQAAVLALELAGEPFEVLTFHCVCRCGCPAVLTTTRHQLGQAAESAAPEERAS